MTVFFDTNVLVYRLIDGDPRKAIAHRLLAAGGCISVQVVNEFANVAHRKLKLAWPDVARALAALRNVLPRPLPLTVGTHMAALGIATRHKASLYDALIIASALEIGCDTLFSEDMQDGMRIEDRLVIRNPFA